MSETVNTFNQGLIMDLNPLVTPNTVMTNCLNGTLVTFQGNENVLQNDMGNGRVETAKLPEGYIPLGTTELGGIIYIVSYNPFTKKSLIGSFPSPERNILSSEISNKENLKIEMNDFIYNSTTEINSSSRVINKYVKKELFDEELNPGDKFLIFYNGTNNDIISAFDNTILNSNINPKYIKFNVVSIYSNGIINNLNKSLIWYKASNGYYYLNPTLNFTDINNQLDEYRNLIEANYSVFDSKVSGKLAILAELECIDNFSVSWDAIKNGNDWNIYLYLNWTYDNPDSPDKINLYGVRVNDKEIIIDNYPKSVKNDTNDIKVNANTVFYTPCYINSTEEAIKDNVYALNGNITIPRRNDGTDNLFLLTTPITPTDNGVNTFIIYPIMPYGYLEWLKREFSIDISKLGTGEIDLKAYKYYYNSDDSITLNWSLEAYPERNKSIKYIDFEFYEYGLLVKLFISNYNEEKNKNSIGFEYNFHHKVIRSLYSGNFEEKINILDKDKLYLVRIVINYNNERYVYFYRFMYTFNIFNNYFYEIEDFKDIKLNDALKLVYNSNNLNIKSNKPEDAYYDSDNNLINSFNEYLDNEGYKEYILKHSYEYDINCDIIGNSGYSALLVKINNLNSNNIEDTFSPKKPLQTSITNGTTTSSLLLETEIKYNPQHNITVDNINYNDKFKLDVNIPFILSYYTKSDIGINYELVPLNISCGWLLVDGGSKNIDLYLSDTYKGRDEATDKTSFEDDVRVHQVISLYASVYNGLDNRLKYCDVLALKFSVYQTATAGSQGISILWGAEGVKNGKDDRCYDQYRNFKLKSNNSDKFHYNTAIIYVFKNNKDDIVLITFNETDAKVWYNIALSTPAGDSNWKRSYKPFVLLEDNEDSDGYTQSITNDVLKTPFDNYYKAKESNKYITKYKWSRLYYYDSFTWTDDIKVPLTGKMLLLVNNGIELESNENIPNLYYDTNIKHNLELKISHNENMDSLIDRIISSNSNNILVALPNDSIKIFKDFNNRFVYDNKGNVSKLKLSNGIDSKFGLLFDQLGTLLLNTNEAIDYNLVHLMGRLEEQFISIKDIIDING